MQSLFDEIVADSIAPFLLSNGFSQQAGERYFYRVIDDINVNISVEPIDDRDATDDHQSFTITCGLFSQTVHTVIGRGLDPFPKGYELLVQLELSDLAGYNGQKLELKSNTDRPRFEGRLLENLQLAVDFLAKHSERSALFDLGIERHQSRLQTYFYRIKDRVNYERYTRSFCAQQLASGEMSEAQLQEKVTLELRTTREKQMANFQPDLPFPDSWGRVCDWVDDLNNATVISGDFELDDDGKTTLTYWLMDPVVQDRFAVFGQTADLNMFCVWKQDDGKMPVVLVGQSGLARVLTATMDDFIQLLAIGYYSPACDDWSQPPVFDSPEIAEQWKNTKFQQFYTATFGKEIPKTGQEIADRASGCDDLFAWLVANEESWKQWAG
jgi:hypothetical protein